MDEEVDFIDEKDMVETGKLLCLTLLSGQVLGAAVFGNSVEGVIMARNELEASKEQVSEIQNGIMQLVEMLEKDENGELVRDSINSMESQVKEGVSVISGLDNIEDMKMMFDSFVGTVVKGALALDDSISKSASVATEDEQNLAPLMAQLRQLSLLGLAVDGDLTNLDMAVTRMDQSVMMKRDEVGLVARQYGLGRPPTAQEKSGNGGSPIMEMSRMINNMMKRDAGSPGRMRPAPNDDYYRAPPAHNYGYYQYGGYQGQGDYGYYADSGQYPPTYPYLDDRLNNPNSYNYNPSPPQRPPGQIPSPIRAEPYRRPEPQVKPTPRMAIEDDDDVDPFVMRYNPNIDEDYANFINNLGG